MLSTKNYFYYLLQPLILKKYNITEDRKSNIGLSLNIIILTNWNMVNYEKHALRVSIVIAAVAKNKLACFWLVARVNKN